MKISLNSTKKGIFYKMERPVELLASNLVQWLSLLPSPLFVAFSGGVDSTVLAKAAVLALHNQSLTDRNHGFLGHGNVIAFNSDIWTDCVIGLYEDSPSAPVGDLEEVQAIAEEIGLSLLTLEAPEIDEPLFIQNDSQRCYYCKKLRYRQIIDFVRAHLSSSDSSGTFVPFKILDGSNADDLKDYRPGHRAVEELDVTRPFIELGYGKEEIRALARFWSLSVAEKPSSPCLVTRLAYGLPVRRDLLKMIGLAEHFLHQLGFPVVRVRMDSEFTARIEVPQNYFPLIVEESIRFQIIKFFHETGFKFVALDMEYFQSGRMNNTLLENSML